MLIQHCHSFTLILVHEFHCNDQTVREQKDDDIFPSLGVGISNAQTSDLLNEISTRQHQVDMLAKHALQHLLLLSFGLEIHALIVSLVDLLHSL